MAFLLTTSYLFFLVSTFPALIAAQPQTTCPSGKTVVNVGYFKEEQPFEVAVKNRWFDTDDTCFIFYPQTSGTKAGMKLQNGELQLSAMGSSPFALTLSRGMKSTDFYTLHSKGDSQGMVTHPSSGIYSPSDLRSKKVAYPKGSTAHFHSLFIAELFAIPFNEIDFKPLSPADIISAWDAGELDAAFCWGGCLDHISTTGTVLITARSLSSWGKETFNNFVYDDAWLAESAANQDIVKKFTKIFTKLDQDYINNNDDWGVGDQNVRDCADVCLRDTSTDAFFAASVKTFEAFEFFTPETQISCRYLADPDLNCAQEGTAVSTSATADFLVDQKVITASFAPSFYSDYITSTYVKDAMASSDTLATLSSSASTYPVNTADNGTPCSGTQTFTSATGTITDGHGVLGTHADGLDCVFVIKPGAANKVVELEFSIMSIEAPFDKINVYDGEYSSSAPPPLLGYLTGRYPYNRFLPDVLKFRSSGDTLSVRFTSNTVADRAYGHLVEDGFTATFQSVDAVANCNNGKYGPDCDLNECIGTAYLTQNTGTITQGQASTYGNNMDCRWVVDLDDSSVDAVVLDFTSFDVEDGFDFVNIYNSEAMDTLVASFTGTSMPPKTEILGSTAVVQFVSDGIGFKGGFDLGYEGKASAGCSVNSDCGDHGTCENGICECSDGYAGSLCSSQYCISSAVGTAMAGTQGKIASQADGVVGYQSNSGCIWDITPGANMGKQPLGVELEISSFDLEVHTSHGDYVSVKDSSGAELDKFVMVDSTCNVDAVCNGPANGECKKADVTELYGVCECKEGFLNGDCSVDARRLYPGETSLTVEFHSDSNNPLTVAGFNAEYFGIYTCPVGDDDLECSGRGTCRLGQCTCTPGLDVADVESCTAVVPSEELNLLDPSLVATGQILVVVNYIIAAILGGLTFVNRKHKVVRASQPLFLYMILFGCCISTTTILFFGQDDSGDRAKAGDVNCMLQPFFYSFGFIFSFAALFAKVTRIVKIFTNKKLSRITITWVDMMKPIALLLFIDLVILFIWSGSDSKLEWVREDMIVDSLGNVLESTGICKSKGGSPWVYGGLILALHFCVLVYGNYMCYLGRNAGVAFSESKYVFMAMVSNLQIMALGVPMLVMVYEDATSNYFMRTGIVFFNDVGVMLLIFIPKFVLVYFGSEDDLASAISTTQTSMGKTQTSSGHTSSNDDGDGARIEELEAAIKELKAENDKLKSA